MSGSWYGSQSDDSSHFERGVDHIYEAFICPLTKEVMHDPVTLENGRTFEREAIEKWFKECRDSRKPLSCPITSQELSSADVSSSIALRNTIEEWRSRNDAAKLDIARQALFIGNTETDILQALMHVQQICRNIRSSRHETKLSMASFLGELPLNNDVKVLVAQTVGSALVNLMRSGDMPQREAALGALNKISSFEGSAKVLINIGILPPLIKDLFYVGPNQLPIRLREVSATILANIVNIGYDFDKVSVGAAHQTLVSEDVVKNLLYLISNTGPSIQCKLLEVLVGVTSCPKTVVNVVSAIKTSGAIISLVQFVEVGENDDLRLAAIKLLHNLSPLLSEELATALCGTVGQLGSLVAIISEKTPITEEQAAAAGLLANLPERDLGLTQELLGVGAFEKIISKVIGIRQGEIKGIRQRFERIFLEGLVRILARITFAFNKETRAITFCQEYNVASLFIHLLQSNGQDKIQIVSAMALKNLSLESKHLTWIPYLPPPKYFGSIFPCMSKPHVVTKLCMIHEGICLLKETFCLVEGQAVEKLVALLDHVNVKVVEAVLAALSSLLEDGLDVEKGVKIIDEAEGIAPILNVLIENRTETLRRRAVWVVERILRVEEIAKEVSKEPSCSAALVDAFQNADNRTRQDAENALRHIDKFFSGSVDFFNSQKVASLANAPIQGQTPLVAHLENLSLMHEDGQNPPIVVDEKASYPIISKAAKEKTGEAECIVVFSCNDNLDVEETSFIKSILKELHAREVTPLTYNLSGRENSDEEMLYKSSVGIMILSDSVARSSQSLDHLVTIMEHGKATNLIIIPIYFKVTHADIEDWFEALNQNSVTAERVQKWKTTMTEIASVDGHEWTKGMEFIVAEEVVRNACLRLYLKNSKNLARILAFINHSQPSEAEIVGLWGMAGIGKTSIAREIFGTLAPQYDLSYFLQDFDLLCKEKGLRQMRDDFFSKLFGEEKLSISASDIKPSFMRDWFHNKTVLVVLDDVTNSRDVEAVVGGFGWFSHGHRVILTSRRKQVLVQCKVKEPYEIQKLCVFESFRLCKQYLKGESLVISELMSCTSGIPLAIKALGSSVSKHHVNNMKFHLHGLRRDPPSQIQEAFRRSFDGLDENEKNIFLDLACFFRGENMDYVVQLLDACGFFTYLGICDLIDESLISLLDNRIEIPIPFQDIGRFIVCEEDENACERSRLWDSNDIVDVLTNNSGMEAIEGIFLDASDLTCELSPHVFSNMYRLRLLKFSGNECKLSLPHGLDTLPDELRLLHWENYPLNYLPRNFNPENLVEVNMPYSNMEKLWEGKKNLEKLKKIKLSHSRKLTDITMLSEALSLEHIDLEGCTSLVDVSTSIPRCGILVSLNMKDCSHLQSLPGMVDLTSLELLNLSGCSELQDIEDFAPNLKELYLDGTAVKELPLSIENLTKLGTLDLENCRRLQKRPLGMGLENSRSILKQQ